MSAHATPLVLTVAWLAVLAASVGAGPRAAAAAVAGTWQGVPLANVAQALPPLVGRPVVLDGRVDPTTPMTLAADGLSPADLLERLGQDSGSEVVVLRESVRLAPPGRRAALQAAEEGRAAQLKAGEPGWRDALHDALQAEIPDQPVIVDCDAGMLRQALTNLLKNAGEAIEERKAAEPGWRNALAHRQPGGWAAAATPRDVVATLVASAGGTLRGLDLVPHDHLRELTLPAMSRAAQLDLLLASYDLRAAIMPTGIDVVRLDPKASPQQPPQLDALRTQRRDTMAEAGVPVFTLEAAAPLQQLLAAICKQTGLTLRLDQPSLHNKGIAADRIVRVTVRDASREQLLNAIAEPLGLHWQIDGDVLVVTAATTPSAAEPAGGEPLRD